MTPSRICFFTDSTLVGGAEIALLQGILALDRDSYQPVLFHHGGPGLAPLLDPLTSAAVPLLQVPELPDRGGATGVPRFVRSLRRLRPAIFHVHQRAPGVCKYAVVAAIAARVRGVVATVHAFPDIELTHLGAFEWSGIARRVDRFLVSSRHGRAALAAAIPGTVGRTEVIPNGIDASRYRVARDPGLRARLAVAGRRVVLVCARLDAEKGHATLLDACRNMPDVQIVIAGEGGARGALEADASSLGMSERVTFLGFRADVPELLAACDVLVLPTRNEAFGLVLLEGMAAERPVISTRVGGPEEIVEDGGSGLLVPRDDPAALADALRAVLDDAALAARLAASGRARVEAEFSARAVARRTAGVYDALLADRRRAAP